MHASSLRRMDQFCQMLHNIIGNTEFSILDVGGIAGASYQDIFLKYFEHYQYNTLNVKFENASLDASDILVDDPYNWNEVKNESYDVVISGQTFEHIEYFWITALEMRRVLKKNGYLCIIAPSHWPEHRVYLDTYRFYADGMNAICKFMGCKLIYSGADQHSGIVNGDAYLIAQKDNCDQEELYLNAQKVLHNIVPKFTPYEISRNKPILQSSHNSRWENKSISPVSNNFTFTYTMHTSFEDNPFIIINLLKRYYITNILVFNRNILQERALDINIILGDNICNMQTFYHSDELFGGAYDNQPLNVTINQYGRYIGIMKLGYGVLHFDQIQVFGYIK